MKKVLSMGVFLAFVFCFIVSVPLHAQVTGATITGTVTDASGAVVAGAQISLKNIATGVSRDGVADSSGFYAVPNLAPGDYEVRVSAQGFSTAVQSNLALAVGQQLQLNFSLKVGETATTVQVTEAAPQIDLTSSALTGQVESETVRDLPLNGRDWTSLATLQPGVKKIETQVGYDSSGRGNRGFGSELTVSGQRSTFNNYRIDGLSVVDYANAAPGNVIGVVLGVDAIEEFSVLTGGFPAEYGRATGGVVNAISKSGTNKFHGDLYEFLRNNVLDANDYFTKSAGKPTPPFKRNQFGGSAGGPIIKDKTFIFGDYEGLRQSKGIPTTVTVPSDAARGGTLQYDPTVSTPAGCTPATPATTPPTCTVNVNDYTKALLALYPHANAAVSGNKGKFIGGGVQAVPENFYTFRVDHTLGSHDSLFGTYLFDDTDYKQPDQMGGVLTNSHTTRTTIAIGENHTFGSNFVNAARIGYNRDHVLNQFTSTAINPAAGNLALGAIVGQYAPRLTPKDGITEFFGGINSASHYLHTWNSFQAYDDAFWSHGTHSIKFGAGVERMQYNQHTYQNLGGRYVFSGLSDFLQGIPASYEAELPFVDQPREFRQTLFGAYVQDDWKMKSNLTLNIGLRYEMTTVLKDAQNRITNLTDITNSSSMTCAMQFTAPIPAQTGSSCSKVGPYYTNPTLRNFEPRIGFAWDPFKDGKSSVRGSFGIYDVLPLPGYFLLQQNQAAPFLIFKSISGASITKQTGFASPFEAGEGGVQLNNPRTSPLSASTIETHPHRNYVMQWNLNVQRQLTSDLSLTVGYVGARGVHLLQRGDDGNMTLPTKTSVGYQFPCGFVANTDTSCTPGTVGGTLGTGGATSAKLNQSLGVIRYVYWNTDSIYHGLNVNLDKRFAHGFQFQVAYTFSKSLDDNSQTIAGDTFSNSINSPWWFLPKLFRGPSDFNVAHDVSINALYDIPVPSSFSGIARTALAGWELGGIFSFNSGTPTTPINAGDPLGLGNTGADQFGPLVKIPGCDPINHGYAGSLPGAPLWINEKCYTEPTVPTSMLGSLPYPCGGFPGAGPAPTGRTWCANLAPGSVLRNSITGPKLYNMDFSVMKNFPVKRISEAFNVQFRTEMFNIFNHRNFSPPQPNSGDSNSGLFNQDGSSAGAGTIATVATDPREIQFALKVIW